MRTKGAWKAEGFEGEDEGGGLRRLRRARTKRAWKASKARREGGGGLRRLRR